MQRASEWGIAGGIGYNRQPVASSIQQFTNDLESGPGSHPGTSIHVHRGMLSSRSFTASSDIGSVSFLGYIWGTDDP